MLFILDLIFKKIDFQIFQILSLRPKKREFHFFEGQKQSVNSEFSHFQLQIKLVRAMLIIFREFNTIELTFCVEFIIILLQEMPNSSTLSNSSLRVA